MTKVYSGFVRIHFEVRECEEDAKEVTPTNRVLIRKCELFTPDYPSLLDAERALEAIQEHVSVAVHEPVRIWPRKPRETKKKR